MTEFPFAGMFMWRSFVPQDDKRDGCGRLKVTRSLTNNNAFLEILNFQFSMLNSQLKLRRVLASNLNIEH